MRKNCVSFVFGCLLVAVFALPGCQWAKEKIGIKEEVSNPESGSPEQVIFDVIKGAIMYRQGKEEEGWALYSKYLHPDEKNPQRLKSWKQNNFLATVRKVHLFTKAQDTKESVKDSDPTFEIARREESGEGKKLKVFVVNEGNDESPTPCKLVLTGDGWRIRDTCL